MARRTRPRGGVECSGQRRSDVIDTRGVESIAVVLNWPSELTK